MMTVAKTSGRRFGAGLLALGLAVAGAVPGAARAQGAGTFKLQGVLTGCTVQDVASPAEPDARDRGPVVISDAQARRAYDCARSRMVAAYAKSGDPWAQAYTSWRQYSTAPYPSSTHGGRRVTNYANAQGTAYGDFEDGVELPAGTVLAKDSFFVNGRGEVVIGALSLMEKMEAGFNPDAGDWRYTLILPDGRVAGTTGGKGAGNVAFCSSCHATMNDTQDAMFFVPRAFRRNDGP